MEANPKAQSLRPVLAVGFTVVTIIASFVGYFLLSETWGKTTTSVEVHSILAFIAVTCSGFILVQYLFGGHEQQTVFHAALLYVAAINIVRAIRIFLDGSIIFDYGTPLMTAIDTFYLSVVAGLLFVGIILKRKRWIRNRALLTILLVVVALIAHLITYLVMIQGVSNAVLQSLSLIFGILAGSLLTVTGIIWSKTPDSLVHFNIPLVILAFAAFGTSWIPMVLSLYYPSNIWLLAYSQRIAGLILLSLAIGVPFLARVGMKPEHGYLLVFGLDLLVLLPAIVTMIGEVYFMFSLLLNRELFLVIHTGAAIVAIIMALLIFYYDTQRPALKRRPIITLFIAWGTIESYLVVASIIFGVELVGQSIIPYLVGITFTVAHLPYAVRYSWHPDQAPREITRRNRLTLLLVAPLILIILVMGEVAGYFLETSILGTYATPIGQSILLLFAMASIFGFVFYSSAQVYESRGRFTVDVLSIGFLALWIIPSIIKSNYQPWTIGWYSAEVLLLLGIILGPAVLGLMYLRELERSELSQRQATLYADLLVHDISNYHQAISLSLGLLEVEGLRSSAKLEALRDANHELKRADLLVRNVRRLGMIEDLSQRKMERVDIVAIIQEAFRIALRKSSSEKIRFSINQTTGSCFVTASDLLIDVFLNLFDNSIEYSKNNPEIEVAIETILNDKKEFWKIDVSDNGIGIEPARRHQLFSRYMVDSKGTGLGLSVVNALVRAFGGSITVNDRINGEYEKGTTFSILLPRA
ncbi:MAG: sensor histidine kinase [Promethearchaeota archaeon]